MIATTVLLSVLSVAQPSHVPRSHALLNGRELVPSRWAGSRCFAPSANPWWLVDTTEWLSVRVDHRTRFEHLENQFRTERRGSDSALSLRTIIDVEARFASVRLRAEVMDSRIYFVDDNTPLDTGLVNALEPLQSFAGLRVQGVLRPGDALDVRLGRMTLNLGSRRLVARNRFRNTINAFNGIDVSWTSPTNDSTRAFVTLPVARRPTDTEELALNQVRIDRESFETVFWGVFMRSRPVFDGLRIEGYIFGLHENEPTTRERQLITPGVRLIRAPAHAKLDGQLELVVQSGSSLVSSAADARTRLDHLAFFLHGTVGYTLDAPWSPRLAVFYDYASGDGDPDDDVVGRFDTLFGARRFEYGPTGLHGAFARSNINTPGAKLSVQPILNADGFFGYRAVWLAQSRDAWTTAGIRDSTGASGAFVGHQIEGRIRWRVVPGTVAVDAGFAHTWLGRFARTAPNANGGGDPTYVYLQISLQT